MVSHSIDSLIPLNNAINVSIIANFIPELVVLLSAITFLMGGVFAANKKADRTFLWFGCAMLTALFLLMLFSPLAIVKQYFFGKMFVTDLFSTVIKLLLIFGTVLTLVISDSWLQKGDNQRFEYLVLILFSLLGMLLMVSANDLLSLYVALELSSLPLYVLASFSRDTLKSTESGLKYFVLGSLASGMILFGASLVYGFAGSTNFESLALLFKASHAASKAVIFGLVLIITGLCFKVSAAPFHMWTPDVYEGAPTPITAFFSVAPKIAAIALFTRVMVQPFGYLLHEWQQVIIFISILSMLVGAFGALAQSNIKRLLAYSSIGHVGYALIGLASDNIDGISGIIIYFMLYTAMSIGAFACILMMQKDGAAKEKISDLAGLSKKQPVMAFCLAVFMFSMAGIPPMAGFFGKMYIFLAAMHAGLFTVAVIGVLSSVVACFYYLKVIKVMYFDDEAEGFDRTVACSLDTAMYICAGITLLFFIVPTPFVNIAHKAAEALFQ